VTDPSIYWIQDAAQIRALESPMRQEIVDAVAAMGPCSILELADHLGRAADSLYFHVKKLVRVKLLLEVEKRKSGRHTWVIYALPSRQVRMVYRPAVMKSIRKVVAGALRLTLREFDRALVQKSGEFSGPRRNMWGGRIKGWLSDADLQEINQLLARILDLMNRQGPGPGRQVLSLGWVLAPAQVRRRAPQLSARSKGKP
jgi:hypothetical protein